MWFLKRWRRRQSTGKRGPMAIGGEIDRLSLRSEPVGRFASENLCDNVTWIMREHKVGFDLRQPSLHRAVLVLQAFRDRFEPTSAAGLVDEETAVRSPMGCARGACIDERQPRTPERCIVDLLELKRVNR